jgi:pimeloyl-ACP methyl ester carboxylesterase
MAAIEPAYMTPDDWRGAGEWISLNKQRLFVAQHGNGLPVLVLHAFPTASYDYCKLVGLLKDRCCFTLFDYPGFGFSDKPRNYKYSLFEYADAAQAVCAHFGLKRVHILAHDIGDSVALELLRRSEPIVESLILLNGSIWSIPFTRWRMRLSQRLSLHPFTGPLVSGLRLFNKSALRSFLLQIFARPLSEKDLEAFWSLIAYNDGAANYHHLMRYMPERWKYQKEWLDALAAHPAPLTLIWGMSDPVATPAVADRVMLQRPYATYIRLNGVGHYPHWEVPDRVASELVTAWQIAGSNTFST